MHTIAARDYKDPKLVVENPVEIKPAHGYFEGSAKETDVISTIDSHINNQHILLGEQIPINNNTKQGYLLAKEGDGIDISGRMKHHRGTVQRESTQTLTTSCDVGVVVNTVNKLGNVYPSGGQNGNVYDQNGISPTIMSGETSNPNNGGIGSNNAPKILVNE